MNEQVEIKLMLVQLVDSHFVHNIKGFEFKYKCV